MPPEESAAPVMTTPAPAAAPVAATPAAEPVEQVTARKTRKELLTALSVKDENEAAELVQLGREALTAKQEAEAAKKDPSVRLKEQLDEAKKTHAAEIAKLQAERDAAVVRDAVRKELAALNVFDGGDALILAMLGIGEREVSPQVEDGEITLVDAKGKPIKESLSAWLKKFVGDRPNLQKPTSTETTETEITKKQAETAHKPRGERAVLQYIQSGLKKAHGG